MPETASGRRPSRRPPSRRTRSERVSSVAARGVVPWVAAPSSWSAEDRWTEPGTTSLRRPSRRARKRLQIQGERRPRGVLLPACERTLSRRQCRRQIGRKRRGSLDTIASTPARSTRSSSSRSSTVHVTTAAPQACAARTLPDVTTEWWRRAPSFACRPGWGGRDRASASVPRAVPIERSARSVRPPRF